MTAPLRAVLFDLDGTLLDTAADLARALNALRTERGLEPLAFGEIRGYVSHGSVALVRLGFPAASAAEQLALRERLLVHYRAALSTDTRPFPGMLELLEALRQAQLGWGVVTNKPGWLTDPLLASMELGGAPEVVVSGDTLAERKPHPLPLLHAAGALGVQPAHCVYVGDAERDVLAARAAGMRALVASYGYFAPSDQPQRWPADGWVDSPADILSWVQRRQCLPARDVREA